MYIFNRIRIVNSTDLPEARELAPRLASAASKVLGKPITALKPSSVDPATSVGRELSKTWQHLAMTARSWPPIPPIRSWSTKVGR